MCPAMNTYATQLSGQSLLCPRLSPHLRFPPRALMRTRDLIHNRITQALIAVLMGFVSGAYLEVMTDVAFAVLFEPS
jgi:hypothetical protein